MANAETQPANKNKGTNSANGEVNNTNAMEEHHDNDSINSEFFIKSIAFNPRVFTFQ